MVHCVDRKINLTPLPTDHRGECLRNTFDHLEPGQSMQAIDDFHPGWIRTFLEEQFNVDLGEGRFVVEENAGRYVVYIEKPSTSGAKTASNGNAVGSR